MAKVEVAFVEVLDTHRCLTQHDNSWLPVLSRLQQDSEICSIISSTKAGPNCLEGDMGIDM